MDRIRNPENEVGTGRYGTYTTFMLAQKDGPSLTKVMQADQMGRE